MNKRDAILNLVNGDSTPDYVPAAFFLHFGSTYQQGQSAIDKHLEFFHFTGMDFVKIQYEQTLPPAPPMLKPTDWVQAPRCSEAFYEPTIRVVEGLVKAAKAEAPVILTVYSPFMLAAQLATPADLGAHLLEDPEAVKKGLDILTENVVTLLRACKKVGIDGFYVSTQGGEAFRFPGNDIFRKYIKPTDLTVWRKIQDLPFNVLHVCDYNGPYDDLSPFTDYPGHVVNCSLQVGGQTLTPKQISQMFGRPFMGGLERKGTLATGDPETVRQAAMDVLAQAPERFILAADCTVPAETPWENLKTAIDIAHQYRNHHE
jgi:uroporphyrinogen decarboxylase